MPPRRRGRIDWAGLDTVELPELVMSGPDETLQPFAGYDGLLFEGRSSTRVAAENASFLDCRITDCSVEAADLRRTRFNTCRLEDVRAATVDLSGATLSDVVVSGSRIGALDAHGASLSRLSLRGCRLDFLNLRGAEVAAVAFRDCRIGELELGGATVRGVRFGDCSVGRLDVQAATVDDLDLTGADLDAVDGIGSLRGATIDEVQLARLAPALADFLGIRVVPPADRR